MSRRATRYLDETYESIIAHELFHHWFGDLVTAESWSNLALNEAFATYGERLWEEHAYGKDAAAYGRHQDLESYLSEAIYNKEAIVNYYYSDAEDLFDRHRYEKGGLVLHMLRQVVGDEVFFAALKQYVRQYAYKTAEIHNLRMVFEEASGQDLNWFFDEWFLKAGHPVLNISQRYNESTKQLSVIVEQTQQENHVPVFKMPVALHIYLPGKILRQQVWISKRKDSFVIDLPQAPLLVNFDAHKYLLAQKTELKPALQWHYQFFHAQNYNDRYEAIQALSLQNLLLPEDSLTRLISAGLQDTFWNIRRRSIEALLANCSRRIQEKYGPEIRKLALYDKNSRVRLSAFMYMQNRKAFFGEDIYADALKDQSYQVVAAAIHSMRINLDKNDALGKKPLLAPFEKYHYSAEVLFALAQFYAQYPDTSNLTFFRNLPVHIQSNEYSRFADAYKLFMENMPADIIIREKNFILRLGPKMTDVWGKLAYKNMLAGFEEKLRKTAVNNPEAKAAADAFRNAAKEVTLNSE